VALSLLVLLAVPDCAKLKNPLAAVQCEQKHGHFVKALERVEQYLATKPKKPPKVALKLRDQLRTQVTTYDIFSEPEGATVTVDGAPLSKPLVVNPGHHAFHVELEGFRPLDRDEIAIAGTHPKLTLVLERLPLADEPVPVIEAKAGLPAAAPEVTAPPRAEGPPAPKADSPLPFVFGGVGLAAVVTGGALLFTSEIQHVQGGRRTASYVVLGVGAALSLTAIIWLLVERRPGADLR
jgi:hypothetical protein